MRLRNLILNNFRCFPSETNTPFELDHSVVLLYGKNGAGKTSFFDAIELSLTSSIGRLRSHDLDARFLINAGQSRLPATIYLDCGTEAVSTTTIHAGLNKVTVNPLLKGRQVDLFRHTSYQPQYGIRRLIESNAEDLGRVVEALVLDEDLKNLVQALAQLNLTRKDRSYQQAKKGIDELESGIKDQNQTLTLRKAELQSIQGARTSASELIVRLGSIYGELGLVFLSQDVSDIAEIAELATQASRELQSRLQTIVKETEAAKKSVDQCTSLLAEEQIIARTRRELDEIEQNVAQISEQLSSIAGTIERESAESDQITSRLGTFRRALLLTQIISEFATEIESGTCPICDRTFANLEVHIQSKINVLNLEESAVRKQHESIQKNLETLTQSERTTRSQLRERQQTANQTKDQIDTANAKIDSYVERFRETGLASLSEILASEEKRLLSLRTNFDSLTNLAERISQVQAESTAASVGTDQRLNQITELERAQVASNAQLKAKRVAMERVDNFIDACQTVRQRLSTKVENVVKEFVEGEACRLFVDLFRRIARDASFSVTLPPAEVRYYKPHVKWNATRGNESYPGDAVFSQGQLNACALSFFFALAITQSNHLGFVLLDDPVQSLDEVHVEEFARLLKSVKDDLGWQLIVAVHEESLFDYLARVLYPSAEGQTLISYQLVGVDGQAQAEITGNYKFEPSAFSLVAK